MLISECRVKKPSRFTHNRISLDNIIIVGKLSVFMNNIRFIPEGKTPSWQWHDSYMQLSSVIKILTSSSSVFCCLDSAQRKYHFWKELTNFHLFTQQTPLAYFYNYLPWRQIYSVSSTAKINISLPPLPLLSSCHKSSLLPV